MKLVAIGDLHGKQDWMSVDVKKFDRIIFIGDYLDDWEHTSDKTILDEFRNVLAFKKQFPEKVTLLLGNHEIHYMFPVKNKFPGYRMTYEKEVTSLLKEHSKLFDVALQIESYLFTHAGLSKQHYHWLMTFEGPRKLFSQYPPGEALTRIQQLNWELLHTVSPVRGGNDVTSGITTADKSETENSFLASIHQVVGHSPVPDILRVGDENGSITYIDVLESRRQFLEIEL